VRRLQGATNHARDPTIGADRHARTIESKRSLTVCQQRTDGCNVQSQIVVRDLEDSSATPWMEDARRVCTHRACAQQTTLAHLSRQGVRRGRSQNYATLARRRCVWNAVAALRR